MDILRELPMGFGMALMQNEDAYRRFSSMPESERREIVNRTHAVTSKTEMQQLVDSIIS
ncbi:hypothetical protein NE562_12825 [Butyricicoccus faecihominis]|uniref:hypothetical protein n=1 Tax=Butyricicoccaceae TaxID=3085642 RepID=UPI00247A1C94|nr:MULTISPECIES: hypothetical protein [Butyricicoccaceae]MCQ5130549.1 hypothetical protein [Butyricicoccus faecihominis]WNX83973.1 hypothetical protein RWV98_15505 [Agathobaculum sp. NTUH-O15-33]